MSLGRKACLWAKNDGYVGQPDWSSWRCPDVFPTLKLPTWTLKRLVDSTNWRGVRQIWCTLYCKYAVIWIVLSADLIYRVKACQDIWSLLILKTQLVKTCLLSIFLRIQFQNLNNKHPVASGTPPGSILADRH